MTEAPMGRGIGVPNRRLGIGLPAALVVIAIVLAAIGDGTLDVIAVALGGLGLVGLVSWAFYEIGLSEDRDRAAGRD
jgi:hypothetical protein